MKKRILCLAAAGVLLLGALGGCGKATEAAAPVKIHTIAGPTGVGMVTLMAENDAKTTENTYQMTVVTDPSQAVAAITGGAADLAVVPTNLAATLYNKTGGDIQVLAVNTLGVLYMLENGSAVHSMADLKGKTIYTAGQGANPEYVLRYLLTKNGIDPDRDVTIVFVADNDELTAAVVTGTAQIALVPEPKVTACIAQVTAAGKTPPTIALSMNEEWNRIAGDDGGLMMGCVIARRSYAEKHPDQIAAFLTEYERSVTAV